MVATAAHSVIRKGHAGLTVELVAGESAVTSAFSSNPLKLLAPRSRGKSVWAYTSSFGGGLVAGDQTHLDVSVGAGARCFLGTQASTKIYRNPLSRACGHTTHATLAEDSLLVFAPDAVQAFAESRYSQRQEFRLGAGAGLVLLDWFNSGRVARGERWAFDRFKSRNEVRDKTTDELIFLDSLVLDSSHSQITSTHVVGRFNCFAILLFLGEPLKEPAADLLNKVATRPIERQSPFISSTSPVRDGAVLRVAGESIEQVGRELHGWLQPLSTLLGDDPWARKW